MPVHLEVDIVAQNGGASIVRAGVIDSDGFRKIVLGFLRTFAHHPFTDIGRALEEFNALIFAADQESDHPVVHQRDVAQVQDVSGAVVIHF